MNDLFEHPRRKNGLMLLLMALFVLTVWIWLEGQPRLNIDHRTMRQSLLVFIVLPLSLSSWWMFLVKPSPEDEVDERESK